MGYPGFQKPIVQNPGLRGIFDIVNPIDPMLPPMDFPLDAGSPSGGGGADGGDAAPAPAPAPGAEVAPQEFFQPPPTFLFPVQEQPVPLPAAPVVAAPAAIPTWAMVGGAALAGIALAVLLFRKG